MIGSASGCAFDKLAATPEPEPMHSSLTGASLSMRGESMTGMKQKEFGERLSAAKDAKQAMVAKFLKRPDPDDPSVVERRQARAAVSAAREARLAERKAA